MTSMSMPTSTSTSTGTSRVIALVDMDCFYVQVEERDDPSIKGVPAAVVQYKAYKGGGIIAVNYEARAKGVTRNMRGDDAKVACPEINLVRVPETRGKADLTKYRDAGRDVIKVLCEFSDFVERASIDEAYIDLSLAVEERMNAFKSAQGLSFTSSQEENNVIKALDMEAFKSNFVLGFESTESWLDMMKDSENMDSNDGLKLAIGAEIVGKMREAVFQKTGFRCSAGIAHNKVLAKLCAGINKPNKQTVLPHSSVGRLWGETKIKKVRNLGGKLGEFLVEKLKCELMSDLLQYSEKELAKHAGSKAGAWIYQLARGYDDEIVNPRQLPKSIGCNKNFFGPEALTTKEKVKFWLEQLTAEVLERIQRDFEVNNRRAKTLTLHITFEEQNSLSRSCRVHPQYNPERIGTDVWSMMEKLYQNLGVLPVHMLGLIASRFEDEADVSGYAKINNFFENGGNRPVGSSSTSTSASKISTPSSTATSNATSSIPYPSNNSSSTTTLPSVSSISSLATVENNANPIQPQKRNPFFHSNPIQTNETSPQKSVASCPIPGVVSPSKLPMAQECERCKKLIPLWDYVSHMDFHVARDLSREINGLPPLGFDLRPDTLEAKERAKDKLEREQRALRSPVKKGPKRPRGRGGGISTGGAKRGKSNATNSPSKPSVMKSIDSYFVKKSSS